MDAGAFSFAELERRIAAMPAGPIGVLDRPRWQYWCDLGGGVAVIVGLLPGVFVQILEPKPWMVTMTYLGLWAMILLFAPGFVRSLWVFGRVLRRGKAQDADQLDFDLSKMNALQAWLANVPLQTLEQHLRFIQTAQVRVAAKLGLVGGSLDRFGILPLILAIAVQVKTFSAAALDIPLWQLLPSLFFAIGYLFSLNASFMRVRMHLYDTVIAESLARRQSDTPPRNPKSRKVES